MKISTIERNFISCSSSFNDAELVIMGVPFDGTVSFRSGTRMAPSAIRNDSIGLETYSPYQNKDLVDYKIHDLGDLDLPFGNTKKTVSIIEDAALIVCNFNKKLLTIGGEHLITYPVIKALLNKYPDMCFLHFDAHADLREDYLGEELSHATALRRVWDLVGDNRIWQFGIRSGSKDEFIWSSNGHTIMEKFTAKSVNEALKQIGERPLYVTVDIDVLDTSVMSGTGTPEAGGLQFIELLNALLETRETNIVGADLVELSPKFDLSGASTAVACKLVRELMLLMLH